MIRHSRRTMELALSSHAGRFEGFGFGAVAEAMSATGNDIAGSFRFRERGIPEPILSA
jgi:hypothetical protein